MANNDDTMDTDMDKGIFDEDEGITATGDQGRVSGSGDFPEEK